MKTKLILSIVFMIVMGLSMNSHAQTTIYEPNDSCTSATPIETDGLEQHHAFEQSGDLDWLQFEGTQGITYVIEVRVPPTSTADIQLQIHDSCGNVNDNFPPDPVSRDIRLVHLAPADGTYYLKLRNKVDSSGNQASYQVSVRAIQDMLASGAVIIVAGRYVENDKVQGNIHHVTGNVYDFALNNGCLPQQIYYMATNTSLPGVTKRSSVDNLREAITEWSVDKVTADQPLTVFMMDHGDNDQLYLDGPDVNITPLDLAAWFDDLEASVPGVKINLVIEACNSGSFIDEAKSVSKQNRVIVTSTGADLDAFASQKGATFSDAFFNSLQQGMSLYHAFAEGRWAVDQAIGESHIKQIPWLDDNGNAQANEKDDGFLAAQRGFACQVITPGKKYPPDITAIEVRDLDPVTEAGNIWTGNIWVKAEVSQNETVKDVWAVIYAPSDKLESKGNEMVKEPVSVDLNNPVDGGYTAQYYFKGAGVYRVVIYAESSSGLVSSPLELKYVIEDSSVYLPVVVKQPATPIDDMVLISSGSLSMGSDDGNDDEQPIHIVYLDAYYIDKYEVTNAQYAVFLNEQGNQSEGGGYWLDATDSNVRIHKTGDSWQADSGYVEHPVVEVSWYGAKAYCEWTGKRLPTEAEWEKAARGTDNRIYPWGNEAPSCTRLNYHDGSSYCVGDTRAVGSYPSGASPYQAHDMAGNVWEWVQDCYDSDYYGTSPSNNPINTSCDNSRVLRGGSWFSDDNVRSAGRGGYDPLGTSGSGGFRCLRSP